MMAVARNRYSLTNTSQQIISGRWHDDEEDAVKMVERQVAKSAAAMLLASRIGEQFHAIVTGASDKGTWARILLPPIEGSLESGFVGVDVGHRLRMQLIRTDLERRGYIDFKSVE